MIIDYTEIMNQLAEIIKIVAPLALTLGLCQWVVRFILSAMLGNYRGRID